MERERTRVLHTFSTDLPAYLHRLCGERVCEQVLALHVMFPDG
jgi:hypothetical protein